MVSWTKRVSEAVAAFAERNALTLASVLPVCAALRGLWPAAGRYTRRRSSEASPATGSPATR